VVVKERPKKRVSPSSEQRKEEEEATPVALSENERKQVSIHRRVMLAPTRSVDRFNP
jgi:hypothetical protein